MCYTNEVVYTTSDDQKGAEKTVETEQLRLVIPLIGNGFLAGVDTFTVILLMSTASLLISAAEYFGLPVPEILSDYSFGVLENPVVCVVLLIWFGLPILLKVFSKSSSLGTIFEVTPEKLNAVINAGILLSQLIANFLPETTAQAAGTLSAGGTVSYGLSIAGCMLLLFIGMMVYFLVR